MILKLISIIKINPQKNLAPAIPAKTVEFQLMAINCKLLLPGHHFLEPFDRRVLEFDDPSTLGTNEMVMVFFIGNIIIQGPGIPEMSLLGQTAMTQEIKSSVNRGQA
jgi:hypothetical protein